MVAVKERSIMCTQPQPVSVRHPNRVQVPAKLRLAVLAIACTLSAGAAANLPSAEAAGHANGDILWTALDGQSPSSPGWSINVMGPNGGHQRQILHFGDYAYDAEVDVSPTTNHMVFVRRGQIWQADTDGTHLRRLTHGHRGNYSPSYSANGRRITFVSERNRVDEIYVMDANGSHGHRLTHYPYNFQPTFSPNGRRIAFVHDKSHYHVWICVVRVNGTHLHCLTHSAVQDASPDYSPSGRKIVFDRAPNKILVMRSDGTHVRRLTGHPTVPSSGRLALNQDPQYSPNGRRIVFGSNRDNNHEIYVMDANGRHERRLTHGRGKDVGPSWGVAGIP
jgi:dipeptidyl aminopeptidase/acylaminoacyl peptidase